MKMGNVKQIHYNMDNIDKIGARFNLIYGERSNGKSYQVKHKKAVEKYLNTFIPNNIGLSLKIEPLFYNAGIEKVRNAKMVKSVTFVLNLGQPLNRFYLEQIKDNDTTIPILEAFSNMAEAVKNDINGKTLSLTLGLGRSGKKEDTLDLDSMLYLLENINRGKYDITVMTLYNQGIFIDVFPFDNVPDDNKERELYLKKMYK